MQRLDDVLFFPSRLLLWDKNLPDWSQLCLNVLL
jgi:hypothetical protein